MKSKSKAAKARKSHSVAKEEKAQLVLSSKLQAFVNDLIDEFFCRMFEVKNGNVYLVIDHYKYIDYKKNAKRVRLGTTVSKDGYYYITHKYAS
jgi:hypothetical protein